MCRKVECSECGKATYAGCGMHVEAVLGGVPPEHRCRCREEDTSANAADPSAVAGVRSILGRLFGT